MRWFILGMLAGMVVLSMMQSKPVKAYGDLDPEKLKQMLEICFKHDTILVRMLTDAKRAGAIEGPIPLPLVRPPWMQP